LREINHWTREEFSEMADISPKFLYEIEIGKKGFSAETLYNIAKALSVNCEYILVGSEIGKYNSELLGVLNMFDGSHLSLLSNIIISIYKMQKDSSSKHTS